MSALTLTLREAPRYPVDLSALRPDLLARLSEREIAATPLWQGNKACALGDLFAISGVPGAETVVIRDSSRRLHGAGAEMNGGRLIVEGDVGDQLGRGMQSGVIVVDGSCGDFACAALRGGRVDIRGDAGDSLGAPLAGERVGMRGGSVLVHGNCGDRAGERQRRGLLLVAGNAGSYCGCNMIAGTLAVLGRADTAAGFGMRRGTVLLGHEPVSTAPAFQETGPCSRAFLTLLQRQLSQLDSAFDRLAEGDLRITRRVGDRACNGQGEILIWAAPS